MLARERLIEIAVSIAVVLTLIGTLYAIGLRFTTVEDGHQVLTATGGEYVVYSIVGFVFLLAIAGLLLLRVVTIVEADDSDGSGNATDG